MLHDLALAFVALLALAAFTAVGLGLCSYRRACRTDPWSESGNE